MATRIPPSTSPDTQFFWDGLKDRELLVQRCARCEALRFPPRPMCPHCQSIEWVTLQCSGRGEVHSFVMPKHPPLPFFDDHHIVALVDLEEGVRLITNLVGTTPDAVSIGMPVTVEYEEFDGGLVLHQFRPMEAR
jgi:uncharacterized protein